MNQSLSTPKRPPPGPIARSLSLSYSTDLAEGIEGIHCVGAVILDSYYYPVAALTVMAPSFRLPKSRFAAIGAHCIAAAEAARQQLLK